MRKLISLIISIFTLTLNINAQSAETILKSAIDKLKSYENISIEFDYNMINAEAGIYETMEGAAFLQGNAYRMLVMDQEIICNGKTMWIYTPENEEVIISDANEDNSGNPLKLIESYYENVTAKFINEDNGSIKKIEATPTSPEEIFSNMIITIDIKSLNIKDIHIFDSNDNEFVYVINKFVTNQKLPADFFTFKEQEHPDAEIIDMR